MRNSRLMSLSQDARKLKWPFLTGGLYYDASFRLVVPRKPMDADCNLLPNLPLGY